MKVLITGATGFVGQAICRILVDAGYQIIKVGGPNHLAGQTEDGKSFADVSVDLTDAGSVAALGGYQDISVIIHCAGLAHQFGKLVKTGKAGKTAFEMINVIGTENMAVQAAEMKVRRLIFISTVSVYGRAGKIGDLKAGEFQESAACRPEGYYGESKLAGEQSAIRICREHNLNLTILRPSTVLGENDPGNVSRLITAVDRRRFLWLGDGSNRKSFLYKDDLGRACLEIIRQSEQRLEILNVSAEAVRVKKVMEWLKDTLQRRIPRIPIQPRLLKKIFNSGQKDGDNAHRGCEQKKRRAKKSENRQTIPAAGRLHRYLKKYSKTLEKWLSEEVYTADKMKKEYGFVPLISVEEAIRRECRAYLEKKC